MIKNYSEWLNESSAVNLGPFKMRFRTHYGHIHHNLSDDDIQAFLAQPHIAKQSLNKQVDLFADYLVSQGMADVVAEQWGEKKPADPEDVDPKELAAGIDVEMEHTFDEKIAKKIALVHLGEDPHYYSKLKKAGLIDEPEALKNLEEMAETDIHFKAVMSLWDKSDNQEKRKILDAVGYGATNRDTLKKALRDMSYEDILDVEKELGLEEPVDD